MMHLHGDTPKVAGIHRGLGKDPLPWVLVFSRWVECLGTLKGCVVHWCVEIEGGVGGVEIGHG